MHVLECDLTLWKTNEVSCTCAWEQQPHPLDRGGRNLLGMRVFPIQLQLFHEKTFSDRNTGWIQHAQRAHTHAHTEYMDKSPVCTHCIHAQSACAHTVRGGTQVQCTLRVCAHPCSKTHILNRMQCAVFTYTRSACRCTPGQHAHTHSVRMHTQNLHTQAVHAHPAVCMHAECPTPCMHAHSVHPPIHPRACPQHAPSDACTWRMHLPQVHVQTHLSMHTHMHICRHTHAHTQRKVLHPHKDIAHQHLINAHRDTACHTHPCPSPPVPGLHLCVQRVLPQHCRSPLSLSFHAQPRGHCSSVCPTCARWHLHRLGQSHRALLFPAAVTCTQCTWSRSSCRVPLPAL